MRKNYEQLELELVLLEEDVIRTSGPKVDVSGNGWGNNFDEPIELGGLEK